MTLRLKQFLAILGGIIVAAAMLLLGVWQMERFQLSMQDVATQRAQMESVELAPAVHSDGTIDDIYGRWVTATGEYLPDYEVVVGEEQPRVATAFRLDDGRHVAVVRGLVDVAGVTDPPAGEVGLKGIFTASDQVMDRPQGSVRVQQLAQEWPSPLVAGYVTLSAADSAAQGLGAAAAELPEGEGTAMHQGYALQWWVFAAAAIAFSIFLARGFRIQDERRRERIARRRAAAAKASSIR